MPWAVTSDTMNVGTNTRGLCVESSDPKLGGSFVIEHTCPQGEFSNEGLALAHELAGVLNAIDHHRFKVHMLIDEHGHPRVPG